MSENISKNFHYKSTFVPFLQISLILARVFIPFIMLYTGHLLQQHSIEHQDSLQQLLEWKESLFHDETDNYRYLILVQRSCHQINADIVKWRLPFQPIYGI